MEHTVTCQEAVGVMIVKELQNQGAVGHIPSVGSVEENRVHCCLLPDGFAWRTQQSRCIAVVAERFSACQEIMFSLERSTRCRLYSI